MTEETTTQLPIPRTWTEAKERLAAAIPNFSERPQQDTLAEAIVEALAAEEPLLAEAGCGTGKSFGALLPALMSGKRVIYSTATKALQTQLATIDLPRLAEIFPGFTWAMLKGRSNYVCHAKVAECEDPDLKGQAMALLGDEDFDGDLEKMTSIPAFGRSKLAISADECPGKNNCPFGASCLPERARQRASEADITVVNHALLVTDARIKAATGGNVSMIGPYDALIIDEGHEFEEYVSGALATTIKAAGILRFAAEIKGFSQRLNMGENDAVVEDLEGSTRALFDYLPVGRLRRVDIMGRDDEDPEFGPIMWYMNLVKAIQGAQAWTMSDAVGDAIHSFPAEDRERLRFTRDRLKRRSAGLVGTLTSMITDPDSDTVRYVEEEWNAKTRSKVKALVVTPVRVSDWLKANLWEFVPTTTIMSATLSVGGKFDYVIDRLGLPRGAGSINVGSPFDFGRQARLYIPSLPDPGKEKQAWANEVLGEISDLVRISKGRALLLFTSRTEMNAAYDALHHRFEDWGFPCLKQGDDTNAALMADFKRDTSSVLFGLKSFFTGIDVQGEALSLVVINKLPFPVPVEPVFQARCEEIERRGGNSFSDLSVPMMALPLQQAAGRLIRTVEDAGVVAILDPRVVTKGYGKTIQNSLPPMPLVRRRGDVEDFFRANP